MIKECGNNYKHIQKERKKKIFGEAKKLRRRNQHTNHRRRFHPWSQISLFLPYPLHVLFQFFSLSLSCSANLSDAWSPHHHHLAAEKQKKKYFSWTRNVFINYCVIVKQQKEKNYLKNILTFFIFLLSVWLYKLNVITKSEHIT